MIKDLEGSSYLFGGNASFVEQLYEAYLKDPASVSDSWRGYFAALQVLPSSDGVENKRDVSHATVLSALTERIRSRRSSAYHSDQGCDREQMNKQAKLGMLVNAYRMLGNRWSNLDPLQSQSRPDIPELDPAFYGFYDVDMDAVYDVDFLATDSQYMKLRDILDLLRSNYCGTIGFEYMHITDPEQRRWLQERIEVTPPTAFASEAKKRFLERLTAAETLELYLGKRYVGVKRFGLEGGESLIVAMDQIVLKAGEHKIDEVVIGMAHRGRLNVLVNMLGKSPAELFSEFEGTQDLEQRSGDVKYHQGFSSDVSTPDGSVHFTLAFNPSHLEIVDPVVMGSVRARQDKRADHGAGTCMSLLIHGDAAFAGQGVVMETLNMSQTRGYSIGGTVHLVVNNQIGFTTSNPEDARSTMYCTDVVKMVEAPVFHVNGDDPEAVAHVTQLAMDFWKRFKKDVVVDIVCFRRLGHNEQDEPFVTQPAMYQRISKHSGVRKLYADKLLASGVLAEGEPEQMIGDYRNALDEGRHMYNPVVVVPFRRYAVDWSQFIAQVYTFDCETTIPAQRVKELGQRLTATPEQFVAHRVVKRVLSDRQKMYCGEKSLDWGAAENLAYASLLDDGFSVRLSGQDCGRGTFAHRHVVVHDQQLDVGANNAYVPLAHLKETQPRFEVIDSVLSEEAVLGFEYGYATAQPNTLTIWEAQFGDFANGAQVLFDQFICSGEVKWGRLCGLVCLLPHGYEGQGPEHSSARLERYLQLCAEYNMEVCVPSSASQIFHLLRRQMLRKQRKPLIVLTPKSLLRKPEAASPLSDFTEGSFQLVVGDEGISSNRYAEIKHVIVCVGKVFYDLSAYRQQQLKESEGQGDERNVAIIRLVQLYPFPHKQFAAQLALFPNLVEVVWCQEEPKNMGAWYQVRHNLEAGLPIGACLRYAGRPMSASPAAGYIVRHVAQQNALVMSAFGEDPEASSVVDE